MGRLITITIKEGILKWIWSSFYIWQLITLGRWAFQDWRRKTSTWQIVSNKDLRPALSYLGIWITRDQNTQAIWINQQAYIENTLKRFELLNANSTNTLLPAGIHLEKSEEPVALDTKTYYQQIIGTLIYAAIGTRPNITFSAMRLSWFNNNPTKEHIKYAKYVLWYLKGTNKLKIKYNESSYARLIGYSDSDWGENRDDCHSTLGHVFLMANSAISWASQQQKNGCIVSGRSWIYRASQHWKTSCMA